MICKVFALTKDRSLSELPDVVFVALGRRGMEPIKLQECAYSCETSNLELIRVITDPPDLKNKGIEEITEDWVVKCEDCDREFTIRCLIRYADGERMDTKVNIIDDKGTDLGWLGSY